MEKNRNIFQWGIDVIEKFYLDVWGIEEDPVSSELCYMIPLFIIINGIKILPFLFLSVYISNKFNLDPNGINAYMPIVITIIFLVLLKIRRMIRNNKE